MWESVKQYVKENLSRMRREPGGILRYPYIVPGSDTYATTLWDWDSWWTCIAIGQADAEEGTAKNSLPYEQGCILNFLDHMDEQGKMPILITNDNFLPDNEMDYIGKNNHKPVLAQHALYTAQKSGDLTWLLPYLDRLDTFVSYFGKYATHEETGLAYWENDFAVGVDNEPIIYFRPEKSTAALYLNCLLYREELAMAKLWVLADRQERAGHWLAAAESLAESVRRYCWDERDQSFYSVDILLQKVDPERWLHHEAPRTWPCLLMRIDTWTNFLPLWAGIATPEQAKKVLRRLENPDSFMGTYGVRTLSKQEPMYNLKATNNPSNWLGPVWGVSNYMVFRGLQRYGFREEATELARRTANLFEKDLKETGTFHEFYDPDRGIGIRTPDFQNWNCLVLNMIAYLEGRTQITEF